MSSVLDWFIIDWVTYEITVAILLIGFIIDVIAGIFSFAVKGKYVIESFLTYMWITTARTGGILFLLMYEGAIEYMVIGSYLVWVWSLLIALLILVGIVAMFDNEILKVENSFK